MIEGFDIVAFQSSSISIIPYGFIGGVPLREELVTWCLSELRRIDIVLNSFFVFIIRSGRKFIINPPHIVSAVKIS